MQPDPPEFPLTTLPYLAHKHVIGSMPLMDKISYSMISDYSKFMVRSLRLSAKQLVVRIDKTEVQITVIDEADPFDVMFTCKLDPKDKKPVKKSGRSSAIRFSTKPRLSPREWLCHFMDIFNCKNLEVRFEKFHQKTSKLVEKMFEGVHVEQVSVTDNSGKLYQKVIAAKAVDKVTLRVRDFFRTTTSDYGCIIFETSEPSFKMKDSPNCNALHLEVYLETTTKTINRFLRRWIKSPNPKLQSMEAHVQFSQDMNNDLFKGIIFTENGSEGIVYNIQSEDGTKATIRQSFRLENLEQKCYLTFSVLRD